MWRDRAAGVVGLLAILAAIALVALSTGVAA